MKDGIAVKILTETEWSIGHDNGNSFTGSVQQIPWEANGPIPSSNEDYPLQLIHHDTTLYNPVYYNLQSSVSTWQVI